MDVEKKKMEKDAVVVGATGLIGSFLVQYLLGYPYRTIHVIGRRPPALTSPRIQFHELDLNNLAAFNLSLQAADGFCCLGTTMKQAQSKEAFRKVDYDYCLEFARFCKRCGVRHLLFVSAIGANPRSRFFYNHVKGEIERALTSERLEQLSILRPSLLIGKHRDSRPLEELSQKLAKVMIGPFRKFGGIKAEHVAKVMAILANSPVPPGKTPAAAVFSSADIQKIANMV
jgi:uncharacterized protein YbjT (DUF2867 family)